LNILSIIITLNHTIWALIQLNKHVKTSISGAVSSQYMHRPTLGCLGEAIIYMRLHAYSAEEAPKLSDLEL